MVFAKELNTYRKLVVSDWLLVLYLFVFPLGQLARLELPLSVGYIAVNIADIALLLFVLAVTVKANLVNLFFSNLDLISFLMVASFSFVLGIFTWSAPLLPGVGYLVRLILYFGLWIVFPTYKIEATKRQVKLWSETSLLLVVGATVILGLVQYVFFPDLRSLYYIGWDDHLNRLGGTFLDPGFTSLFFVFGTIVTLGLYLKTQKISYLILAGIFSLVLGLTYARAGFLALMVSLGFLLVKHKKFLWLILGLVLFSSLMVVLPKKPGEGTNLTRLYSIDLRLKNYQETVNIFKTNPLFGVGYTNLCAYRVNVLNFSDTDSHACSGADNGILFILATTGVVGLISFINFLVKLVKATTTNIYGDIFVTCLVALGVHMQFVNSIFNPWVLGFLGFLYLQSRDYAANKTQNLH